MRTLTDWFAQPHAPRAGRLLSSEPTQPFRRYPSVPNIAPAKPRDLVQLDGEPPASDRRSAELNSPNDKRHRWHHRLKAMRASRGPSGCSLSMIMTERIRRRETSSQCCCSLCIPVVEAMQRMTGGLSGLPDMTGLQSTTMRCRDLRKAAADDIGVR